MDPLQDPRLWAHVSASICISGFSTRSMSSDLWILYKIHVFGLMSQHFCISGSSARSMSPDPYISIHMYLRILCKIHVSDSGLSIHVSTSLNLRILCKIHVSGSMSQHPYISQELLQDPCVRFMSYSILIIRICGPAQAKRKF